MEARQPTTSSPPPLRRGAADQAAATLDLLRAWSVEDPAGDREILTLLEQSQRDEPLTLSRDGDRADRS
jgi:hypothetical protein